MAVVQVVGELEEDAGLQPLGVLPIQADGQGQLVGGGEGYTKLLVHQQVGVVPDHVQGQVAVAAVEGHAQLEGQAVLPQKIQQPPHAHLEPEGLPDLEGTLAGDSLDLGELFGMLLQDVEGVGAELLHQPPGGGGAYPFDGAGGQVFKDGLFSHGDAPLHDLGLELLAVGGVAAPGALDGQTLAGCGAGHAAHHRHRLAVSHAEAEDGIAVFLVAEDDGLHRPLHQGEFFGRLHVHPTSFQSR